MWSPGLSRSADSERSVLEKQIDVLKAEAREEERACWQDVARLKEELRRWTKQYRDLSSRVRLMFDGR